MKIINLTFFIIMFQGCCTSRPGVKPYANIEGEWYLNSDQVNYPTITFEKGGLILNSKADTIYGYVYNLKKNDLILSDGNSVIHNKILKLTHDSLVLETLLDLKTQQVYLRMTQQ